MSEPDLDWDPADWDATVKDSATGENTDGCRSQQDGIVKLIKLLVNIQCDLRGNNQILQDLK